MTNQEKIDEINRLKKERAETIQACKDLVFRLDYDQTCNWLDTIGEKEIDVLISEFSKDSEMDEKLLIIKGYYNNKYGENR